MLKTHGGIAFAGLGGAILIAGERDMSRNERNRSARGRSRTMIWIEAHEFSLIAGLSAATGGVGYLIERSLLPWGIAGFEFIAGTTFWFARRLFRQLGESTARIVESNAQLTESVMDLVQAARLSDMLEAVREEHMAKDLSDIVESIGALHDRRHLRSIVCHELSDLAERSKVLAASSLHSFTPKVPNVEAKDYVRQFMSAMPPKFAYDTISNLTFWSPEVLSNVLEIMQLNVGVAVERKGHIRRVMLVKADTELTPQQRTILEKHRRLSIKHHDQLETKVLPALPEDFERFGNFGIARDGNGRAAVLIANYTTDGRLLRLDVDQKTAGEKDDLFELAWNMAVKIDDYLALK